MCRGLQKQSEGATEQSSTQNEEDASQSEDMSGQCATAQDSAQQPSSATITNQSATARIGALPPHTTETRQGADKTTTGASASATSAPKKPDYAWVSQPIGLKGTHAE